MLLIYLSANSYEYIKKDGLNQKMHATEIMSECNKFLSKQRDIPKYDIYKSGLIGLESTYITTILENDSINLRDSKVACTHPNFAALVVEMFQEIELESNDSIAVSMTGSLPGANLAVLSAAKAMGLKVTLISSVGSSAWGANKENFSWLEIESLLYENNLINYKSIASSIGGENDLGDNLSDKGIEIIEDIIYSKDINFINNNNLNENTASKIQLYKNKKTISNYKAYINVGGGASSIGFGEGKEKMKIGVIYPIERDEINFEGFENSAASYFLDNDVIFINIKSINLLAKKAGLYPPNASITINNGDLFYLKGKYNLLVILISIVFSLCSIGGVGIYSHMEIKKRMQQYEPDSII